MLALLLNCLEATPNEPLVGSPTGDVLCNIQLLIVMSGSNRFSVLAVLPRCVVVLLPQAWASSTLGCCLQCS
jgi:hypothetical protein